MVKHSVDPQINIRDGIIGDEIFCDILVLVEGRFIPGPCPIDSFIVPWISQNLEITVVLVIRSGEVHAELKAK